MIFRNSVLQVMIIIVISWCHSTFLSELIMHRIFWGFFLTVPSSSLTSKMVKAPSLWVKSKVQQGEIYLRPHRQCLPTIMHCPQRRHSYCFLILIAPFSHNMTQDCHPVVTITFAFYISKSKTSEFHQAGSTYISVLDTRVHRHTHKALRRQSLFPHVKKMSNFTRNLQMAGKWQAFRLLKHEIRVVPVTIPVFGCTEINLRQHRRNNGECGF